MTKFCVEVRTLAGPELKLDLHGWSDDKLLAYFDAQFGARFGMHSNEAGIALVVWQDGVASPLNSDMAVYREETGIWELME